jgi:hypothetical protein
MGNPSLSYLETASQDAAQHQRAEARKAKTGRRPVFRVKPAPQGSESEQVAILQS